MAFSIEGRDNGNEKPPTPPLKDSQYLDNRNPKTPPPHPHPDEITEFTFGESPRRFPPYESSPVSDAKYHNPRSPPPKPLPAKREPYVPPLPRFGRRFSQAFDNIDDTTPRRTLYPAEVSSYICQVTPLRFPPDESHHTGNPQHVDYHDRQTLLPRPYPPQVSGYNFGDPAPRYHPSFKRPATSPITAQKLPVQKIPKLGSPLGGYHFYNCSPAPEHFDNPSNVRRGSHPIEPIRHVGRSHKTDYNKFTASKLVAPTPVRYPAFSQVLNDSSQGPVRPSLQHPRSRLFPEANPPGGRGTRQGSTRSPVRRVGNKPNRVERAERANRGIPLSPLGPPRTPPSKTLRDSKDYVLPPGTPHTPPSRSRPNWTQTPSPGELEWDSDSDLDDYGGEEIEDDAIDEVYDEQYIGEGETESEAESDNELTPKPTKHYRNDEADQKREDKKDPGGEGIARVDFAAAIPQKLHIRFVRLPEYLVGEPFQQLFDNQALPTTTTPQCLFTALNVEPDENPQEELDNTREIQVEEALRFYQNALKLHSQGPKFYDDAASAYEALFKSEVFKYPESLSEYDRIEQHPESEYEPDLAIGLQLDLAAAGASDGSSSLAQILYLSYKNYGQFIIDCIKHDLKIGLKMTDDELRKQMTLALSQFIKALERDESDTELWRKASKVGRSLGSNTISRYCLESAVEVDDDPTQDEVDPSALEEGFAGVLLMEHLSALGDDVALSHPIMGPYLKKSMSPVLKKYMDPYPFLPDLSKRTEIEASDEVSSTSTVRLTVETMERTWSALGSAFLGSYLTTGGICTGITIAAPEDDQDMDEKEPSQLPAPEPRENSDTKMANHDDIMQDISESPTPLLQDAAGDTETAETEVGQADPDTSHLTNGRKRTQSAAGLRDAAEEENGAQKRSKRIRARDTILGAESLPTDPTARFQEQLAEFVTADTGMFNFINSLLEKLEVTTLGTLTTLQNIIESDKPLYGTEKLENTVVKDVYSIMDNWNEAKAAAFVTGNAADLTGVGGGARAGLAAFHEHTKTGPSKSSTPLPFQQSAGVTKFIDIINNGYFPLQDAIGEYFIALQSSYAETPWPTTMKHTVVQLLSAVDAPIYTSLRDLHDLAKQAGGHANSMHMVEEQVQMIFELHLDLYIAITHPASRVEASTRLMEKDRLARWASFAMEVAQDRVCGPEDPLSLRYMWAMVLYFSVQDGAERDYIVNMWNDLKDTIEDAGQPIIELHNNVAMPEVSMAAADREVSKLTTTDFFLNLFQSDRADPVVVIETLEPVLDPRSFAPASDAEGQVADDHKAVDESAAFQNPLVSDDLRNMWKFLRGGNASLRLFLWQRLREAYSNIDYVTKVFSCYLRSIEVVIGDLMTTMFVEASSDARQHQILQWLKTIDDLLVKALTLALNDPKAFDAIDYEHLQSTTTALVHLCRFLHAAALFEDQVRVGAINLSQRRNYQSGGLWNSVTVRFREMQVRVWALLYTMIKEGIAQNPAEFSTVDNDLADYLGVVHYALGLRKICKVSNKIFLKMTKVELLRLEHVEGWEDYLGQILFDLYQIKLGVGRYELTDHGCSSEPLDRRTAFMIADKVIGLANNMTMKDLLKSELRPTIEKMQQITGQLKMTAAMQHNYRNLNEYLKTTINPLVMNQALRGQLYLDSLPVHGAAESPLADKGWYFLHGMMALTKFKSQKRLAPGATDDLRVAMVFFRSQLQFTAESWESWYRLGQCYDADLEENVLFSADKLNNPTERKLLTSTQRNAIHCYLMAASVGMRSADMTKYETVSKFGDLLHDLGMRIYASTRKPFDMQVFSLVDNQRVFSGPAGLYKKDVHVELTESKAWRFAANLFIRASAEKPEFWLNHYMLGKCFWKMYTIHEKVTDEYERRYLATKPTIKMILGAFERAIDTCPKPSRADPILEPHYKYMSIMHKLVLRGQIDLQEAADKLQSQPYAINKGAKVEVSDIAGWRPFVLESIRSVQHADKSNWHHRMIFRIARILYDEYNPSLPTAIEARTELKVSMFTKTMVFNVWKPEFERAGRHCVYTEIYIKYMTNLLSVLDDRTNLELLCKRVRRKQADIYGFQGVWVDCMSAYVDLIRLDSNVVSRLEEVMKVPIDEFNATADALKTHVDEVATKDDTTQLDLLPFMKEAEELKKVNAGAMKNHAVDDLLQDLYSAIYLDVGVGLSRPQPETAVQELPEDVKPPPAAPAPTPAPEPARFQGPMSIHSMLGIVDTSAAETTIEQQPATTPAPTPSAAAAPTTNVVERPRMKYATRKDILRRAEALIAKPIETAAGKAIGARGKHGVGDSGKNGGKDSLKEDDRNTSPTGDGAEGGDGDGDGDDGAESKGGDGEDSKDGNAAGGDGGEGGENENDGEGSGDDADDESDLSDVPDEEDLGHGPGPAILFPNLVTTTTTTSTPKEVEE